MNGWRPVRRGAAAHLHRIERQPQAAQLYQNIGSRLMALLQTAPKRAGAPGIPSIGVVEGRDPGTSRSPTIDDHDEGVCEAPGRTMSLS